MKKIFFVIGVFISSIAMATPSVTINNISGQDATVHYKTCTTPSLSSPSPTCTGIKSILVEKNKSRSLNLPTDSSPYQGMEFDTITMGSHSVDYSKSHEEGMTGIAITDNATPNAKVRLEILGGTTIQANFIDACGVSSCNGNICESKSCSDQALFVKQK